MARDMSDFAKRQGFCEKSRIWDVRMFLVRFCDGCTTLLFPDEISLSSGNG